MGTSRYTVWAHPRDDRLAALRRQCGIAAVDVVGGRRTGWSPDTDTAPVGAVGYLSLTAHCGTASAASRTSGPPNFAAGR